MGGPEAEFPTEDPNLRMEDGVLVFSMPVEIYDALMNAERLPRGACYNGPREALEVEPIPNGRYHDHRADALFKMFEKLRESSATNAYAATTAPLEGAQGDRRHPDVQFFVSPDKLRALAADSIPAPIADLAVEIDMNPLSRGREIERRAAYLRLGVSELWIWERTGGSEREPEGRASLFVASGGSYAEAAESPAVPGLRPADLEALMSERDNLARVERARELAERLAPAFARRWDGEQNL